MMYTIVLERWGAAPAFRPRCLCLPLKIGEMEKAMGYDVKVPRRIVAIEISQGTSQIPRKNNFSI